MVPLHVSVVPYFFRNSITSLFTVVVAAGCGLYLQLLLMENQPKITNSYFVNYHCRRCSKRQLQSVAQSFAYACCGGRMIELYTCRRCGTAYPQNFLKSIDFVCPVCTHSYKRLNGRRWDAWKCLDS